MNLLNIHYFKFSNTPGPGYDTRRRSHSRRDNRLPTNACNYIYRVFKKLLLLKIYPIPPLSSLTIVIASKRS